MFLFTLADSTVPYKPPLDLEAWMEQYGTELLRLCYLYIKDHQLAEDAVQDTFVKAYTKYDSFRGNSSIKTWLTAIAINVCRDIMRRRSYHERPLMLSQDEIPVPSTVRLQGSISPYARQSLQQWLQDDIGVPKEHQIWIG